VILYPKFYLNSVKDIDVEFVKKNNIKGLLLDVDNTLIDIDRNLLDGTVEWCQTLKQNGIKICILSNTSKKEKAENVANALNIPYINFAKKPFRKGFYRGQKKLEIKNNNEIAVVGDQIFTDVIGANKVNMISILVKPVCEKDLWYTRIKRPLERVIIKKFLKQSKKY
jgi:hypothetical protein